MEGEDTTIKLPVLKIPEEIKPAINKEDFIKGFTAELITGTNVKEVIADLEKRKGDFPIKDIDDSKGIKAYSGFRKSVRRHRLDFTNAAKLYLEFWKEINKELKDEIEGVINSFKAIEEPMEAKEKEIALQREERKEAEEKAAAEKFMGRMKVLTELAVPVVGVDYVAGDHKISIVSVQGLDDEKWDEFVKEAKHQFKKKQKQQADLERENAELKAKVSEFEEKEPETITSPEPDPDPVEESSDELPDLETKSPEEAGEPDITAEEGYYRALKRMDVPKSLENHHNSYVKAIEEAISK